MSDQEKKDGIHIHIYITSTPYQKPKTTTPRAITAINFSLLIVIIVLTLLANSGVTSFSDVKKIFTEKISIGEKQKHENDCFTPTTAKFIFPENRKVNNNICDAGCLFQLSTGPIDGVFMGVATGKRCE
jgi:hypothetical protein